ncbi:MAG: amino acid adenylation domain-containing protein, partial [Alphaproteobacteria bacterium]|nr:amino acid adenylation domain-containing protein [Alphaproteobacteria bacterium]
SAYEHQDVPFEQLVDHLKIERELNRNPVFQVQFGFQTSRDEKPIKLNDLEMNSINLGHYISKFDLSLTVIEEEEDIIWVGVEYSRDLFDEKTIARMVRHYERSVDILSENPKLQLKECDILSEEERHQQLIEWNKTKISYEKKGQTVISLFEQQVEKTPAAIALMYEGEQLSYRALNARANQLAWYLQERGVGPESLVGICLERSLDLIVSILAVHKVGGAYVPLDPNYPKERLSYMLSDIRPKLVLSHLGLVGCFEGYKGEAILLDEEREKIEGFSSENLAIKPLASHMAYVIYTSGSTGQPKGVMVQHGSVINCVRAVRNAINATEYNRYLALTAMTFDVSVVDYALPLTTGASIIMASDSVRRNAYEIFNYFNKYLITNIQATPSVLSLLLDCEGELTQETTFLSAGEALSLDLSGRLAEKGNLFNLYGPTEATIYSSCLHYHLKDTQAISIGMPIENLQLYIFDAHLQLLPQGAMGELYIGGIGLARGYLNRPDLTAERFIPNPFSEEPGARLYRTGDLVRYLPDGNIEYIGRIDHQIKIRGYRIELGEIESILRGHASVEDTVVIAQEDGDDKYLIAYLVTSEKATLSEEQGRYIDEVRNYLKAHLPDYMVPSYFMILPELPLSSNGKIDRKALPAFDKGQRQVGEIYQAPSNEIEKKLADIWSTLLQVETIGVHDNFFALGGHSLLGTRLISRIRQVFSVSLPLKSIFEYPTIKGLFSLLEENKNTTLATTLSIPRCKSLNNIPLSFAQQRLWFLDKLMPSSNLYNVPVALRLKGNLDLIALENAITSIMKRHEILRTQFVSEQNGEVYQVINDPSPLKIHVEDLSKLSPKSQEKEAKRRAEEETSKPFDLSNDPMMRIRILRIESKDYILLITFHHIVTDGWSLGIFFKELESYYEGWIRNKEIHLGKLSIQYKDFAAWQRTWLQGEELEKQLHFWKNHLEDIPDVLQLPTDKPRPKELSYQGGLYKTTLGQDITKKIKQFAQEKNCSLFMVLLSAYQLLLHLYSGQDDVVVGSPIANRNRQELEGLIGFFINILAFRSHYRGEESFEEHLTRTKKVTLEAYEHQDIPFDQLVDYLEIGRELNRNPVFQAMLILQNANDSQPVSLHGLKIESFDLTHYISKFDLSLIATEEEEGISLGFEYSKDLFDESSIIRMAQHYERCLEAMILQPDKCLREFNILSKKEESQQLIEWNNTQAEYEEQGETISSLFEKLTEKTPDAIALIYEGQQITYKALNARANQLARYLQEQGVVSESLVGICLERSVDLLVSIFAVYKLGGAYVPLDPSYPKERLSYMLEDTEAKILISNSELVECFEEYEGRIILSDELEEKMRNFPSDNLILKHSPENIAYVIYTSGSTGKPKGVMGTHSGIINRFRWMWNLYPFQRNEIAIQKTSINFGDSLWEMFGSILQGIKLLIVSNKIVKNVPEFICYLNDYSVTRIVLVPSFLDTILSYSHAAKEPLKYLKICVVSGEALTLDIYSKFFELYSNVTLLNLYGSTEVSADATFWDCSSFKGRILIGKPISNTEVYLLDKYAQEVPIGVTGSLYVGGRGLARGYLNKPDLTAKSFVPNPFSSRAGDRLYRTGDLARYLPDGSIEYLGREDHQVKIRGHRIELGEISSILRSHDKIHLAAVTVTEKAGEKYLVAHVVPKNLLTKKDDSNEFINELKGFLKNSLPSHMVPTYFSILENMPLNTSGKIDYKKLEKISLDSLTDESKNYAHPTSENEIYIVTAFEKVLDNKKVGVNDNFFDIGGNSLLAIRLITELRKEYGIELPLPQLFENSTPRGLARLLKTDFNEEFPLSVIPIRITGKKIPLFLIHPVGGLGFPYFSLRYYIDDRAVYAINNPKFGNKEGNFSSIEEMATTYIKIMRNIQSEGPYIIGGWSFGGLVSIEMAKQLNKIGESVQQVILIDTYNYSKPKEIPHDSIIQEQFKRTLKNENINIDASEGELLLQEMCNNYKLLLRYIPSRLSVKVALIKATIIPQDAESRAIDDLFNGWLSVFPQNLAVYSIAATHDNVFKDGYIDTLSEKLNIILDDLREKNSHEIMDSISLTLSHAEKNIDEYVINKIISDYTDDNFYHKNKA